MQFYVVDCLQLQEQINRCQYAEQAVSSLGLEGVTVKLDAEEESTAVNTVLQSSPSDSSQLGASPRSARDKRSHRQAAQHGAARRGLNPLKCPAPPHAVSHAACSVKTVSHAHSRLVHDNEL